MSNTLDIKILYEDDNIVAIDKPAGILVHADGKATGPFLTDWIIEKFPQTKDVGEPARSQKGEDLFRPGIVHRLDKETSGVLLVAKTQKGFECLKKQFQDRVIKKKYLAWVWGEMEDDFGTINRPIGRSSSDFRKWSAQRGARGEMREAETYWSKYAPMIEMGEGSEKKKFTLIQAEPKTGRTHQIRVHLSAIQHPVVGDMLYAPKRPKALGFDRVALHARYIQFLNCEGKEIKIESPLPEDFVRAASTRDTGIE